jgi:hypothetical protein
VDRVSFPSGSSATPVRRGAGARPFLAALLLNAALVPAGASALWAQAEHQHGPAGAGGARGESHRLHQFRAHPVETGPVIDGVLDEAVWAGAEVIGTFLQQEPTEGAPASERTEIRVLYDAGSLYFGIRAFDSDPDGVVATEMRRNADRILEEDNIQIILDTFMDSRSGYMFVVTPRGARLEQQVSDEGEGGRRGASANINRDWDGVWSAQARITPEGWVAEVAIPFSTLRFPDARGQGWGVNFMRNIARKNEQAYWAPIPRGYGLTRVSLAGSMTGLEGLRSGRDLRVKPFVLGGGKQSTLDGVRTRESTTEVGVDLRYGITAGLNLDLTLNTDFAQAEVDDERVNLTRFALFFPEKREFFLENAGQFNVGTTTSMDRMADLFFSRRIGLTESGGRVPLLGGARMSGKVGRNSLAILSVQTDEAFGQSGENFLVTRYSRDVFSRSRVGGIFVNRSEWGGDRYNRTAGLDFTLAPHPALSVNGFVAGTSTAGEGGDGMGGHVRAAWLDPRWNVYGEFTNLADEFNPEVGFVPRRGIRTSKLHLERTPRPGRFGIRVLQPMYNITYTTDQGGRLLSQRHHYMVGSDWEDGSTFIVWYNDYRERLDEPFVLRPGLVVAPGDYRFGEWRFWYMSNRAARVFGSLSWSPQDFFDGRRTDSSVQLGVRLTPQLATEAGFTRNDVDLPEGAFTADIGTFRLDYALSPDMQLRSLIQYNSLTEQWSSSARFRFTYRPGSDLYLVYDNVRRDGLVEVRDHQLILKATYLMGW